jgi:hypothetical protein
MTQAPGARTREDRLERWERRANPFIVVAAIVPIVVAFTRDPTEGVTPFVDIASWLVFAVDLAVHMRLSDRYLSTRRGRFDLGIVVLTFPWCLLLPGSDATQVLALARLARLGRIWSRSRDRAGSVASRNASGRPPRPPAPSRSRAR